MADWRDVNGQFLTVPGYNDSRLATEFPSEIQDLQGTLREQIDVTTGDRRMLRFIKNAAAGAALAANDLCWFDTASHISVDSRVASSVGDRNGIAGIAIGAIAAGNYGWILVRGQATLNLKAAVNAAEGDALISSDTDVKVDSVAEGTAPTYKVVGFATAAASGAGGTVATYVEIE